MMLQLLLCEVRAARVCFHPSLFALTGLWAFLQTAVLLLRIDDIVSGHKKKGEEHSKAPAPTEAAQE